MIRDLYTPFEHGHSFAAPEFKANACLGVVSHSCLPACLLASLIAIRDSQEEQRLKEREGEPLRTHVYFKRHYVVQCTCSSAELLIYCDCIFICSRTGEKPCHRKSMCRAAVAWWWMDEEEEEEEQGVLLVAVHNNLNGTHYHKLFD